jgi:hypothetical protein
MDLSPAGSEQLIVSTIKTVSINNKGTMKRVLLILTALILLIGVCAASLLVMNFQAKQSQSNVDKQVATYTSQPENSSGFPTQMRLAIYVQGSDPVANTLRETLKERLSQAPAFQQVELLNEPPEISDQAVLVIEFDQRHIIWTPVKSVSQIALQAAFASDGDVSWRHEKPVIMRNDGESVVRVEGEFNFRDDTLGLVSRPAYQQYLGEQLASSISEALQDALKTSTTSYYPQSTD